MTPAAKRRRLQFSLRELLMATALVAAVIWACIETLKTDQSKADAVSLKNENAFLETRIKTQEKLVHAIDEIMKDRRRALPVKGSVPNHGLEPTD